MAFRISRQRHRARGAHASRHVDHLAAVLRNLDRDLRIDVEAVLQPPREFLLDRPNRQPGRLDPADQRKVEGPIGIDRDGPGQIGFAEHGDCELVLRANDILSRRTR